MNDEGTLHYFSLGNAEGPESNDLPLLLRRVADHIETLGIESEDVMDVVVSGDEVTEHGSWWRVAVYWSSESTDEPT